MEEPEERRNKWALGLAVTCSVFIFFGWAAFNGYLNFGNNGTVVDQKSASQTAAVVSAKEVPSLTQNTKETFKSAYSEIGEKYQEFKDSISAVFVPFITGIEVYERE